MTLGFPYLTALLSEVGFLHCLLATGCMQLVLLIDKEVNEFSKKDLRM